MTGTVLASRCAIGVSFTIMSSLNEEDVNLGGRNRGVEHGPKHPVHENVESQLSL